MFSSSGLSTSDAGAAALAATIHFSEIVMTPPPLTSMPEPAADEAARLIAFIARGCENSFKHLVQTSRSRLFAIIYRVNNNEAQAEEILQEVYLKVWTSSDRFSTVQTNGNAWLNAMARNKAIDSLRRNACRPVFETHLEDSEQDSFAPIESPLDGPLQILITSRREAYLNASFELLPIEDSHVVKLSFFNELSHQQIATLLGKPLGSIKTRIRRALLRMQLTTPLDA